MEKTRKVLITGAVIIVCVFAIGLVVYVINNQRKEAESPQNIQNIQVTITLSESDKAIAKIKAKYPELSDYPSNSLPPKSIRYAQVNDTWYVAFLQEGSGIPIISAKCFNVDGKGAVSLFGEFTPKDSDVLTNPFSPIACKLL